MTYGAQFRFTLFTNSPTRAAAADRAGVERIGLDLERIGKAERQQGLGTWISPHVEAELPAVYAAVRAPQRFVRCNPPHPELAAEIERLVAAGAQTIMLPHFHAVAQVVDFVAAVGGRARCVALIETVRAIDQIERLKRIVGLDEIHFGLNDLSLDMGAESPFAMLCNPLLEDACAVLTAEQFPFGVGGIGRPMDTTLPIPSDLIYAQYPRLGASGALLSRVFFRDLSEVELAGQLSLARERLNHWSRQPAAALRAARQALSVQIARLPARRTRG